MADRSTYVRTGNSLFSRIGNKLSLIPFVGGFVSLPFLSLGVLFDSGKWLVRGKIGSALTELTAGAASAAVNLVPFSKEISATSSLIWWGGNVGSAAFTQHTLGTHARALTESVIGGITGALGMTPQVLKAYPAVIGSLPGSANYYAQNDGPGYWSTRAAQQQGVDPNARWQQFSNGDGREHVEALRNAVTNGPQYRGA